MKQFEAELLKDDWTRVRPEVEVKKVPIPNGEETYILCRTSGRAQKEKAIQNRFSNSMETALKGLEKAIVTGRLKNRNKMERRLGKIQARHSQVNDLYDLALRDTPEGVRLFWEMKKIARTGVIRATALIFAHQSVSQVGRRVVVQVHAVDRSRGLIPGAEERIVDSAFVSSVGAARERM